MKHLVFVVPLLFYVVEVSVIALPHLHLHGFDTLPYFLKIFFTLPSCIFTRLMPLTGCCNFLPSMV